MEQTTKLNELYADSNFNLAAITQEDTIFNSTCDYYTLETLTDLKSNKTGLNILHLNIHSLISKKNQLINLLNTLQETNNTIDIILLCETFLKERLKNKCNIKGYKLQMVRNREINKQGGIAIYVKKGLKVFNRDDLTIFKENFFESCFIELKTKDNKKI